MMGRMFEEVRCSVVDTVNDREGYRPLELGQVCRARAVYSCTTQSTLFSVQICWQKYVWANPSGSGPSDGV